MGMLRDLHGGPQKLSAIHLHKNTLQRKDGANKIKEIHRVFKEMIPAKNREKERQT